MKNLTKYQIKQIAKTTKDCWVCRYGAKNAEKLRLAVSREFIQEKRGVK